MAWYDVGETILLVVCGLFELALVVAILGLLVVLVQSVLISRRPLPTVTTLMGTFVKQGDSWFTTHESGVLLWVRDIEGEPDPSHLDRLPEILADLPRLEAIARANYDFPEDDDPWTVRSLSRGEGDEIVLGMGAEWDEQADLGTVVVTFQGDEFVSAVFVD